MRSVRERFVDLARDVAGAGKLAYPLAEMDDLLTAAGPEDIQALPRPEIEDPYRLNYVTAMVELAAHRTSVLPPPWTADVLPVPEPVFATASILLRAHLLTASPPPFSRRNIFIDSSLGD